MEARNILETQEERAIAMQALEGNAGTGSISGANSGLGESATGAAEETEDPDLGVLQKRQYKIWRMIEQVCNEGLELADGTEKEET